MLCNIDPIQPTGHINMEPFRGCYEDSSSSPINSLHPDLEGSGLGRGSCAEPKIPKNLKPCEAIGDEVGPWQSMPQAARKESCGKGVQAYSPLEY